MIQICSFSEAGGHPTNEDAFVLQQLPGEGEGWFVCLADGQGGRSGGRQAAQLACRTVVETATSRPEMLDGGPCSWTELLARADDAVAADPIAGFTTLIGFNVRGNAIVGASSGDSAVLAACGSGAVTELTAHQLKNPPVGSGEAWFIPFEVEVVRPWRLLAMSDGVWKYVGWDRVRELATRLSGEMLLAELQTAARLRGSGQFPDDFTVVMIEAID